MWSSGQTRRRGQIPHRHGCPVKGPGEARGRTRVALLQGRATLPGPFTGQPLRGWTKSRHFSVGSVRNSPAIASPRLLELAAFASSRGDAEFVHVA